MATVPHSRRSYRGSAVDQRALTRMSSEEKPPLAERRHAIGNSLPFAFQAAGHNLLIPVPDDTAHIMLAAQRLRRAMDIIQSMPSPRREAFLLHRLEELSYPQIAKRMGVSLNAVEKHIAAALEQLHREIAA